MKLEVRAWTEVAQICCDPAALPEWFDPESGKAMNRLEKEGLAWVFNCRDEDEFLVRVYVDEPMPEALRKASTGPQVIERFPVPSGLLRICGVEHCRRAEEGEGDCRLKPGHYRLAAWLVDPEGYALEKLRPARLPDFWILVLEILLVFTAFVFTASLLVFAKGASPVTFTSGRPLYVLLTAVVAWALVFWLHRGRLATKTDPRVQGLAGQTPALVLEMRLEY